VTNLDKLKNAWDDLAERDALGAILTDDSKREANGISRSSWLPAMWKSKRS
jgi:hypothetical protein